MVCLIATFAAARMWSISHRHGYAAAAADFVLGSYGSAVLAL